MTLRLAAYPRALLLAISLATIQAGCTQSGTDAQSPQSAERIVLSMDSPSAGWTATPMEAWETHESVYCLFQLTPPSGMAAQVITKVESEMNVASTGKPAKIAVLGKSWNWSPSGAIEFPPSYEAFKNALPADASRIDILASDA